jgi:hypothetical protein
MADYTYGHRVTCAIMRFVIPNVENPAFGFGSGYALEADTPRLLTRCALLRLQVRYLRAVIHD